MTPEILPNPLFSLQCYKIFGSREEDRLTWHSARSACIELGGNLASIHNDQVQGMKSQPFGVRYDASKCH